MELDHINPYFPVEDRGKGKNGAYIYLFPEIIFTETQYEQIKAANRTVRAQFNGLYTKTTLSPVSVTIGVDLSDFPKKLHDNILESIVAAMNHVTGIQKVIVDDGSMLRPAPKAKSEPQTEPEEPDWNRILGLTALSLSYPVHAEGMDGECFSYRIYFSDGTAGEEKANAVRDAVLAFDFGLNGDDYIGYTDFSADEQTVSVYLDLGNTEPQNQYKIMHGILLALNSVPGIQKAILNEDV